MDAKKLLLEIIKISDMYRVEIIIRESLHIIKNDPVDDEYRKAKYKLAGNGRCVKKGIKDQQQYNLVRLKTNKEHGK